MPNLFSIKDEILNYTDFNPIWWTQESEVIALLTEVFAASKAITSPSDFSDQLFMSQVAWISNRYGNNKDIKISALRSLVGFYKYLNNEFSDCQLFNNSRILFPALLDNRNFVTIWLDKGYRFITYSPDIAYDGNDHIIVLMHGMDRESPRRKSEDYVSINLDGIVSSFYKSLIFKYAVSTKSRIITFSPTPFSLILNSLSEIKKKDLSNPESFISSGEAHYILDIVRNKVSASSGSNYITSFRAFVSWCVDNGCLNVEDTFFDELRYFSHRSYEPQTKKINASNLKLLLDSSAKHAFDSPHQYLAFDSVFRLILQTNIRISSICSLKRDCIVPSLKPGKYKIKFITKTSYGDSDDETTITSADKAVIDNMCRCSEEFLSLAQNALKDLIFLTKLPNRHNKINVVDCFSFRLYLHKLCEENGLPYYSAINCRKTYMSNVKDYIIETGKGDADYKALSRHLNVSTTERHYVQTDIERYFEAMYEVDTSNVSINVKNKLTPKIESKSNPIEISGKQCGICQASNCQLLSALPCYICKNFITSPEFLPVFEHMVDDIDNRLLIAVKPHDREDLVSIKEVLVKYIIELQCLINESHN